MLKRSLCAKKGRLKKNDYTFDRVFMDLTQDFLDRKTRVTRLRLEFVSFLDLIIGEI